MSRLVDAVALPILTLFLVVCFALDVIGDGLMSAGRWLCGLEAE